MGACFLSFKNNVESALPKCGDSCYQTVFSTRMKKETTQTRTRLADPLLLLPLVMVVYGQNSPALPASFAHIAVLQVHMLFHAAQPPPTPFLALFPD